MYLSFEVTVQYVFGAVGDKIKGYKNSAQTIKFNCDLILDITINTQINEAIFLNIKL